MTESAALPDIDVGPEVDPLDDIDLDLTPEPATRPEPKRDGPLDLDKPRKFGTGDCLYSDIETIPDFDRLDLFDLPPLPTVGEFTPDADLMGVEEFLSSDIKSMKDTLAAKNPPPAWVDKIEAAERDAKKPRKGVFDLLNEKRANWSSAADAERARNKELSLNPLYCRIVSIGYAVGDDEPVCMIDKTGKDEARILEAFWKLFARFSPVIGFNFRGFDMPVLLCRSIILDVSPPRIVDRRKYGSRDIVDLMIELWGDRAPTGFNMKRTAKLLGIDVPPDHGDGSQVYPLWQARDFGGIARYQRDDVRIIQQLHRNKLAGRFCV